MALTVFGRTAIDLDELKFLHVNTLEDGSPEALIVFRDDSRYSFGGADAQKVDEFLSGKYAPPSYIPTEGRPAAGVAG